MKTAIRYYSKFGHTKLMSEVIAGVTAATPATVSVPIDEDVDILFLGAGVFLGKVDKRVFSFIENLVPSRVKCVVLYGSSAIIDSPVPQMRAKLEKRGISVSEKSFSCKGSMGPLHSGHPNQDDLRALREFVEQFYAGFGKGPCAGRDCINPF